MFLSILDISNSAIIQIIWSSPCDLELLRFYCTYVFFFIICTDFVINPEGKSAVCILHEYTQHVIRVQPVYTFTEIGNWRHRGYLFFSVKDRIEWTPSVIFSLMAAPLVKILPMVFTR